MSSEGKPPSLLDRIRIERSGLTQCLLDEIAFEKGLSREHRDKPAVRRKLVEGAAAALYDAYFDRLVGVAAPPPSSRAQKILHEIVDLDIGKRVQSRSRAKTIPVAPKRRPR